MFLFALAAAAQDPTDYIGACYEKPTCAAHAMATDDIVRIAQTYCKDMGPKPKNLTLEQQMDPTDFCYIYWRGWWDNRKQELDK